MRLIDADKLKEKKYNYNISLSKEVVDYSDIEEAPTVEAKPVKHGKWIFHSFDEIMNGDWIITNDWVGNGYECSECGKIYEQNKKPHTFRFCPTCGAKMNGENTL